MRRALIELLAALRREPPDLEAFAGLSISGVAAVLEEAFRVDEPPEALREALEAIVDDQLERQARFMRNA